MTEDAERAKKKIETVTTYYLYRYGEIICKFFPGIASVNVFVDQLNSVFQKYDSRIALSMNPDHILDEMRLSCVSSALMVGWWSVISENETEPIYWLKKVGAKLNDSGMLDTESDNIQNKNESHAAIEISENGGKIVVHGGTPIKNDDYFVVKQYTDIVNLRSKYDRILPAKNFGSIFASEVSRVQAQKRKEGIPDPNQHPYGEFIGNYSDLVMHFRKAYGKTKRAYN